MDFLLGKIPLGLLVDHLLVDRENGGFDWCWVCLVDFPKTTT
jgi:hypothetical protein